MYIFKAKLKYVFFTYQKEECFDHIDFKKNLYGQILSSASVQWLIAENA